MPMPPSRYAAAAIPMVTARSSAAAAMPCSAKEAAAVKTKTASDQAAPPAPRFSRGADVGVRNRIALVPGRWLVIYNRAKVVSAFAGADFYVVEYPAASKSVPGRVVRVPASDVREPHRAPPASGRTKRPPERGADGSKKAKRTRPGIPEDALRRYMEDHGMELAPKPMHCC